MREGRYSRHLRILSFVLSSRGKTIPEIERILREDGFEVCSRTIRRDLQMLQNAGFPIYTEKTARGTVWKITDGFKNTPPIPISLLQAFALVVAERSFAAFGNTFVAEQIASLLKEVRCKHTPEFEKALQTLEEGIFAQPTIPFSRPLPESVYDTLVRAIREQVKVKVEYQNASGVKSKDRILAPLKLVLAGQQLYLAAYCYAKKGMRWFKLSRLLAVKLTGESFVPKPEWDEQIKRNTTNVMGVFPAEPVEVELEIDDKLRQYFEEAPLHASQKITRVRGATHLILRVGINETLVHELMGFGTRVRVVRPAELAYLLLERHTAAIEFQKQLLDNQDSGELALEFE